MNKPLAQEAAKPKATAEGQFQWQDPLLLSEQLSEDERLMSQAARTFCQERLQPVVRDMNRHESFDPALMRDPMGPVQFGAGMAAVGADQHGAGAAHLGHHAAAAFGAGHRGGPSGEQGFRSLEVTVFGRGDPRAPGAPPGALRY